MPVSIAMVKLASVPINTYSVVRISFALFNSPKRNTDFAASKKPTPSILPISTNVSIRIRSIYPIHSPAFGRLCMFGDAGVHFSRNIPKRMDEGFSIRMYANAINQTLAGRTPIVKSIVPSVPKRFHQRRITTPMWQS